MAAPRPSIGGGPAQVVERPVTPHDESFLRAVYASSRADELARVPWTSEQRGAFLDFQYRAQAADYTRRFPDSRHRVVLAGGTPVGRIWVQRDRDEVRLLDITILPEHRNRGIGTALLRGLQQEARDAGVPLHHTVLTSNDAALRLYLRLGFEVIDTTETHALMEWRAG